MRVTRNASNEKYTDVGNARRLVARHGSEIIHVPELGWMVWDERRWLRDNAGSVLELAKIIYGEIASWPEWPFRPQNVITLFSGVLIPMVVIALNVIKISTGS